MWLLSRMSDLDLLDLLAADHENLLESGPLVVTIVSQHLSVERDLLYPIIRESCRDGDALVDGLREVERRLEQRLRDFEPDPSAGPRSALDEAIREHVDYQAKLFPRLRREIPRSALEAALPTVPLSIGGSPTHAHPNLAEGGPAGEVVEDVVSVIDHVRDRLHHRASGETSTPEG